MKKQTAKDKKHESRGMKEYEEKSPAQKKALKGKSVAKRHEIEGGEKANKKLAAKRRKK
jgi:hypothetical protein